MERVESHRRFRRGGGNGFMRGVEVWPGALSDLFPRRRTVPAGRSGQRVWLALHQTKRPAEVRRLYVALDRWGADVGRTRTHCLASRGAPVRARRRAVAGRTGD